jgi:hypothetical protein
MAPVCPTSVYLSGIINEQPQRYLDDTGQLSDVPHNYIYNETFDNLEIQSHRRVLCVIFK